VSGARAAILGAVLAVAVAVLHRGFVRLVDASGARDQPAVILVLLLAAFLGLLTAVVTRSLRLPGATAPTVLVLGWILVPPLLGAIPSAATDTLAGDAALTASDAIALVVGTLAATVTLGVPVEGRR
jgi:hypothetical protein